MRSDLAGALTDIEVLQADSQKADGIHRDHEARLRILEAFKWKLAGACLALGSLAGCAASWIALAAHR